MPPHRPTLDQPGRITRPAPRGSRERPSPQTAGEGPFPGGGRPPQHLTRHHQGEQRHSYRAGTSSTTTQLRKTDTLVAGSAHPGCRRQWFRPCAQVQSRSCACVQIGAWAGVGPVLTPVRRLRHRQCHFSAGAAEGKFAHRTSQNHAQAQSSAKSTPTPQNRSAPPPTERPCASPSPSPSLRSTSTSAWAALSPQRRTRSRHPGKAGKGPLPKLPGRVLCRAAADRRNTPRAAIRESSRHSHRASRSSTTAQLRKTDTPAAGITHPGWRRHWCRSCTQVQSWFCACVRTGAWACAGPVLTPVRRLRHRQCHFSAGAAEGKFAHRTSQNHAQAQSSAKSTPTPQNRSAPPTTGRPCASPSPSLRSTSASAWAALSPQRRARSQHPGKAGRSSTTTQLRKTDTLVAGSAHPGWRRHWCRPCAQIQSRFCAGVRTGAWICAGRRPQLPGTEKTLRPTRAHRGPQTAPCANVNGIAGPGAFYYTGRIPAANRRRRPDRITRSYTKCKPAEPRPVCTGAPARFCHW